MPKTALYKISKLDIILIVIISLFAFISFLLLNSNSLWQSTVRGQALLYQEDKLWKKIDLNKDRMITLFNGRMQIEVKAGRIRVAKSDCPQHLCVNMGWIRHSGQTIACVPNKVLIEIESVKSSPVDTVCY